MPRQSSAPADTAAYRAGLLTLVGQTNVGKSTLLNRLVGQKVAIVTPKPQTTRRRIAGIRTDDDSQIIIIDSPGFHDSRQPLNRRMIETARRCMAEGEVILAMLPAGPAEPSRADRALLNEVVRLGRPVVVAINKIDRYPRERVLPLIQTVHRAAAQAEIVPISALTGENVDELLRVIKPLLPQGPALMPVDEYTDQTERMIAEEIIREKIFLQMSEEIPFSTTVTIEEFLEEEKLTRISALIVVVRESHKGMIIGAGGLRLKQIGTQARIELEQLLGRHIFLSLRVKVEPGWTGDPRKLKEFGL